MTILFNNVNSITLKNIYDEIEIDCKEVVLVQSASAVTEEQISLYKCSQGFVKVSNKPIHRHEDIYSVKIET